MQNGYLNSQIGKFTNFRFANRPHTTLKISTFHHFCEFDASKKLLKIELIFYTQIL